MTRIHTLALGGFLALGSFFFAWAADAPHLGGAQGFDTTGRMRNEAVSIGGPFENDTGRDICGLVVAPAEGSDTTDRKVTGIRVTGWDNFFFDDDDDNAISEQEATEREPGDGPYDDSAHGGPAGHALRRGGKCIRRGASFSALVHVSQPASTRWRFQATGPDGEQINPRKPVDEDSGVQTAVLYTNYGLRSVSFGGPNSDETASITRVFVTAPAGITMLKVLSPATPGAWDQTTRTFTFTPAIPPGREFYLVATIDQLDSEKSKTVLEYTAHFDE